MAAQLSRFFLDRFFLGREDSPVGYIIATLESDDGRIVRTAAKDVDTLIVRLRHDYGFQDSDLIPILAKLVTFLQQNIQAGLSPISRPLIDQVIKDAESASIRLAMSY